MKELQAQENAVLFVRFVAVIVVSLLLGFALGSLELFEKTMVGSSKLSASHIVRFLGYGSALVVFWLMVQAATLLLARENGRWSPLQHVLLPLATLIVVSLGYSVLLEVLAPLMSHKVRQFYNWTFILGTISSAGWLLTAMYNQSSSLTDMLVKGLKKGEQNSRLCSPCGAANPDSARFCTQCGKGL